MKIRFDPVKLAPVLAGFFRCWTRTLRYEYDPVQLHTMLDMQRNAEPLLLALWHNELVALTGLGLRVKLPMATVVSQSKDGEIIAQMLERIGHSTVRGSSTRGGVRALLGVKKLMRQENRVGVLTIDGPRGPRHEPKDGVIFLAHRAKAKILPLRAFPTTKYVFEKSWDRFELPAPFTKCRLEFGTPYAVEADKLTDEVLVLERERLKRKMRELGAGRE